MLKLKNIVKNYIAGEEVVHALKGVSIDFRRSEFVSILGPSGCGKTTLLNIVGGLDKYTSGDLIINGRSTKDFKDKDWDTYRNHSIGFVFQSYNLIPHQTVLENVELALTLSGVSKKERKEKAKNALIQVGLKDQIKKRPNQLSGGQMQRVAIARALVNDPDIILADEPTGALDSETSIQIMEILKEISKEKLIIMVTHNPEIAENYSNRIIRLMDGKIIGDTNPYEETHNKSIEEIEKEKQNAARLNEKTSMSFFTALSLSLKNLFTKKTRTFLTSFAGSIGIIGIATILSLSSGFENYISKVEEDTLSTYPISIYQTNMDYSSALTQMLKSEKIENQEEDKIYANNVMGQVVTAMKEGIKTNDLVSFKKHIEENQEKWDEYAYVQYNYGVSLNVYNQPNLEENTIEQIVPFKVDKETANLLKMAGFNTDELSEMMNQMPSWTEMIDNEELLKSQYDLLKGDWPKRADEVVIIVDANNMVNDFTLCSLGLESFGEVLFNALKDENERKTYSYSFNDILYRPYQVVPSSSFYVDEDQNGVYQKNTKENNVINAVKGNQAIEVKVSGIIRQKKNATMGSINGVVGYTHALVEKMIDMSNNSEVVKAQNATPDIDVLTGEAFAEEDDLTNNLVAFGQRDLTSPSYINIYPKSFENKDKIELLIEDYNNSLGEGKEGISYSDYIGDMMASISTIINAISYVLIGFVSISLVVSSIMIGIITYISVLERTKEIGVLRAIGASKKDVSRVFNAETLIVGFVSGVLGIAITLVIDLLINIILEPIILIPSIAKLPFMGAIILILISVVLTMVAGLIPSGLAAKKDPVIALRSE